MKLQGRWPDIMVIGLAIILRFSLSGPGWMHIDERAFILHPLGFWSGDFNPHFFNYPTLQLYLASGLYYIYFLLFSSESLDSFIAYRYFVDAGDLLLISRCLTGAMAVGTVAVVMRVGSCLYGRAGGILAGLILAVMPLHVRFSHLAATDVPAALWIGLAVLWSVRITQRGSRSDYVIAGCFAGLAAATKYPAGLVVVPVLVAVFLRSRTLKQTGPWLVGAAALAASAMATPYVWLDSSHFWTDLSTMASAHLVESRHRAEASSFLHLIGHNLRYGLGFAGLLTTALALLWKPRRFSHGELVVASAAIAFAIFAGMARSSFMRYAVPLAPLAALLMVRPILGMGLRRFVVCAWVAAVLLEPAHASVQTRLLLAGRDTRIQLDGWLSRNFPLGVRMIRMIRTQSDVTHFNPAAISPREFHFAERFGSLRLERAWELLSRRRYLPPFYVFTNQRTLDQARLDTSGAKTHALLIGYDHPLMGSSDSEPSVGALSGFEWMAELSPGRVEDAVFDPADWYFLPIAGWSGVSAVGPTIRLAVLDLALKEECRQLENTSNSSTCSRPQPAPPPRAGGRTP